MPSTYVIELTPSGRAAVAVVLVAGPDAAKVVDNCFAPVSGRPIADARIGQIMLGRWGGTNGEEMIACRRAEDEIEIHCHGGAAAVGTIIGHMVDRGCRRFSWQDWLRSQRSRISPKLAFASRKDATTRAAQIALADATTERTAAILLDQYHGALSAEIDAAIAAISSADWSQAAEIIDGLLGRREVGLHLTAPWRVVLAGPPNVGKSSLINALAGFQRAIVSPMPGTTRDVVTLTTAIDGWPVQLSDTAGLRPAQDELESAGIALATQSLATADLVVLVDDAAMLSEEKFPGDDKLLGILANIRSASRIIRVLNKIDLTDSTRQREAATAPAIATSALTGEGIADLGAAIGRALVPIAPPCGTGVPFTTGQIEALAAALAAIDDRDAGAADAQMRALLAGVDEI